MPQYPYLYYRSPFAEPDTLPAQVLDTVRADSVVPSFITSGFGHAITPLPRVGYDVLIGWNLVVMALVLLLFVLNKQLYPRQFRQILTVPAGVAHTNQLLREWNPVGSFLGMSFAMAYILIMALFAQKSCVILSRDVTRFNSFQVFSIMLAGVMGWVLLRYVFLYFMNWLFQTRDAIDRQMTVQLSVSILSLIAMLLVLLVMLYNPYTLFVWIGFAILALAALMRTVMGTYETRISTKMPRFFIFLYFCALEIAPMALLLTASVRYFNQGSVF